MSEQFPLAPTLANASLQGLPAFVEKLPYRTETEAKHEPSDAVVPKLPFFGKEGAFQDPGLNRASFHLPGEPRRNDYTVAWNTPSLAVILASATAISLRSRSAFA